MAGNPDSPIRPGSSFGEIEVLEPIGHGAFSVVYRAHDTLIDRAVALKVLDSSRWPDHETARGAILREANMVAKILDPYVVTLYKVHELPNDRWAFEMEYLDGGSLADRLKREGPLEAAEVRRILEAVLRGLHAAHQRGIVHHDVKPGNVLLGKDGAVMLTDFGLGRFVAEDDLARGPRSRLRGTPYYMAPEVVMGRAAQKASDLWSVGVLLYRMLSGRVPFPARTVESLFLAIQNATPVPLPEGTPPLLASIALRCMAKRPEERPPSAKALLDELARHGGTFEAAPVDLAVAGGPTIFLAGREKELGVLRSHLDEVRGGHGRAVLVRGEAGIGKSALMQELGREARSQGFRWVEVRLSPLEGLRRPLAQAFHDAVVGDTELSGSSGYASGSASSRGLDLLRRLKDEESSAPTELPLQSSTEIELALAALAETRPVALLVEDVHHCDHDELQVLTALGASVASSPVYLAMTYRTRELRDSDSSDGPPSGYYDLAAAPDGTRIELEPLGDRAIRTLLEQASGLPALPLQLVERVIRDSDGVPLYALELYRHLEASGEIEREADTVRITKRWGQAELPRPLRDMVRRRLAGVAEDERTLLDTAAVAGVEFDGAVLADVVGVPLLGVLRALQRLYRERALVIPLEEGYRFGHAVYQEAIYTEMAPDLRRALHRAWAEAMEARSSTDGGDSEALGWHWEQAGLPEKAAGPLALAARAAAGRGEHSRAWRLADRAGVLDETASPEELRANFKLLVSLGSTYATEEDARRLEGLYERLAQAAEALGDDDMRRCTVVAESWHRSSLASGPPVDLVALEEAAIHLPDGTARGDAWWLFGRDAGVGGDFATARNAFERANAAYTACGKTERTVQPLHTLASIHRQECDFDTAEKILERMVAVVRTRHGNSAQAALGRALAIVTASQSGRTEGAGDALDEPIRWLERLDQGARAAHATVWQALTYEAEGRVADARAAIQRAEPTLRPSVLGPALWSLLRTKARLQIAAGELEAAEITLQEAEGAAGTLGPIDQAALAEQQAFLGTVLGEHEDARGKVLAALDQVATTSQLLDLGRLLVEMLQLSVLGLDLSDALSTIHDLGVSNVPRPPLIDLALRIARISLRRDLKEVDAGELERAAALARDPRLGWHQATMGAVASLLSAQANLLGGERDAAASLLLEARQRAQHLQHVWLELRALQIGRDANLDVDPVRVRVLADLLRDHNPADPARTAHVVASWTSGMPRA